MATTIGAILQAMRVAVKATPRATGALWPEADGTERQESAFDADADFAITTTTRATGEATGIGGVQMIEQRVVVELRKLLVGDANLEEPVFLEEARRVGDAVELAAYPAGTTFVLVDDLGRVTREAGNAEWAVVQVQIRVLYEAAYSAAA